MKYVKNITAIIGLFAAINGLLVIFFDSDTPIGAFYERVWFSLILGHKARPNVPNPFASGEHHYVVYEPDQSLLQSVLRRTEAAVDRTIYTVSKRETDEVTFATSILFFAPTMSHADHEIDKIISKVVQLEDVDGVVNTSGTFRMFEAKDLEQFCEKFRVYTPHRLCF